MEWRGFGTEEDDIFLSGVNLFSSTSLFANDSSFGPSSDLRHSSSYGNRVQPSLAPNLQPFPSSTQTSNLDFQMMHEDDALFDSLRITPSILTKEKKSWSDVVGHNYTIPLQQQTTEEPVKQCTEVCRYWLNGNCIYGDKCWYAHHTTPQEETRKQPFFDEISTTCCICQDDILKSHKRFGLMQSTLFGWSLP